MQRNGIVTVNVVLDLAGSTLEGLVSVAKNIVGPDAKGHYRLDTADLLGQMISTFLIEKDFAEYVGNPANYEKIMPKKP